MLYHQDQSLDYFLLIFFWDLFCFLKETEIAGYSVDTWPYNANLTKELVINKLKELSINFLLLPRSKEAIAKVHNQDIEPDDS